MTSEVQQLMNNAISSFKDKKYADSERLFRQVIALDPQHSDAIHNLGIIAKKFGKFDAAEKLMAAAIKLQPDSAQYWQSLFEVYMSTEKYAKAKKVIEIAGANKIHIQYANDIISSKSQSNIEHISLTPKIRELCLAKIERFCDELCYGESLSEVPEYIEVKSAFDRGKLEEILGKLDDVLSTYTLSSLAMFAKGLAIQYLQSEKVCWYWYEQSLNLCNINITLIEQMLSLNLPEIMGEENEVLFFISRVLKIESTVTINKLVGIQYLKLSKYEDAILHFEHYLREEPYNDEVLSLYISTLVNTNQYERAKVKVAELLSLLPNNVSLQYQYAVIEHKTGNYIEANALADAILKDNPNHVDTIVLRAVGAVETKDPVSAVKYAHKVHKLGQVKEDEAANIKIQMVDLIPSQLEPVTELTEINKTLEQNYFSFIRAGNFSNESVANFVNMNLLSLPTGLLERKHTITQTFRRIGFNLGCRQYMRYFDETGFVAENCFSCYKVQIDAKNLVDLIKLRLSFENIPETNGFIKKCMVEFRPGASGFYKLFYYCRSLDQAIFIENAFLTAITDLLEIDVASKIKRGCSEFTAKYPAFEFNGDEAKLMNFPSSWKVNENVHGLEVSEQDFKTVRKFSANDLLIVRNWIDYARIVGDGTSSYFSNIPKGSFMTHDKLIERYNTF